MTSYNATIRIKRSLWDEFKTKCNDDGSNATAEITKFIEIYLAEGNYKAEEEKLPVAFITLKEAVVAEVLNCFTRHFEVMAEANKALIHAEINHLNSGNAEENSEDASDEKQAREEKPRSAKNVADFRSDLSDNQSSIPLLAENNAKSKSNSTHTSNSKIRASDVDNSIPAAKLHDPSSETKEVLETRFYSDSDLIEIENLKVSRQTVGRWRRGKRSLPKNLADRWQPNGSYWQKTN